MQNIIQGGSSFNMNTIYNKNLMYLKNRFPDLYKENKNLIDHFCDSDNVFMNIAASRDNLTTASQNIAGKIIAIHSKYNINNESKSAITSAIKIRAAELNYKKEEENTFDNIVFFGFGLGHGVITSAADYCDKNIILIEPDFKQFLSALLLVDWQKVFLHNNLILLISATVAQCVTVINHYGVLKSIFIINQNHSAHDAQFFNDLQKDILKHKSKEKINAATLKRFGKLWNRNCKLNAATVKTLQSIAIYKKAFNNIPFLVLAAGPSLSVALPYLSELKNRCAIIAVDSALMACLKIGVSPHFVIITDAQRAAFLHIARAKCPNTILIAPIEVYPAVYRTHFKKIVVCKSAVPAGAFFEGSDKKAGDLDSGGSVACSAVNFAAFCQNGNATRKIFIAGLDLSYPKSQTHITGGTGEVMALSKTNRVNSVVTTNAKIIFSANTKVALDYSGRKILSDDKMEMFAYYLKNRIKTFYNTQIFNISDSALKIDGIDYINIKELLKIAKVPNQLFDNISR